MTTHSSKRFLTLLLIGAMAALTPQWALASTAPCTPISNTATVSYKVGTVDQDDKTSAPATFNVGVKVIVAVATTDVANVSVTPSSTPVALEFTVTNNGNAVQDYDLAYEAFASLAAGPFGGTDSFNGTTIAVYAETNGTAGYQDGADTATTIDDLAADGGSKTVYIVYTPSDLKESDAAVAAYYLSATSKWADGSAIVPGSGTPTLAQAGGVCDGSTTVDVVYGDADGPATGDGAKDGIDSAASAYEVDSATIGVTKGYTVVSDPINGASSPKAIPGAVVRYSIAIANTGGASAVLSTISDTLAATLQVVSTAGNATWAVPASTRAVKSGTLTVDTADAGADGLGHADTTSVAGDLTATLTTILAADGANGYAAGELKPGETITLTFDATIQ